jgi:hypothetical protein
VDLIAIMPLKGRGRLIDLRVGQILGGHLAARASNETEDGKLATIETISPPANVASPIRRVAILFNFARRYWRKIAVITDLAGEPSPVFVFSFGRAAVFVMTTGY